MVTWVKHSNNKETNNKKKETPEEFYAPPAREGMGMGL